MICNVVLEWAFLKISCFFFKEKFFSFTMSTFFFVFWPPWQACGILVSQPGIKPGPVAVKALSPNHWNIKEFPKMWIFESNFGKNGHIGFHPDLTSPLLSTWTLCYVPKPSKVLFITLFSLPLTAFSSCPSPSWSRLRADPQVSLTFQGLSIFLCLITSHQLNYLSQLSLELSSRGTVVCLIHLYPPTPKSALRPALSKNAGSICS